MRHDSQPSMDSSVNCISPTTSLRVPFRLYLAILYTHAHFASIRYAMYRSVCSWSELSGKIELIWHPKEMLGSNGWTTFGSPLKGRDLLRTSHGDGGLARRSTRSHVFIGLSNR